MNCVKCGQEISNGNAFCSNCGTPAPVAAPIQTPAAYSGPAYGSTPPPGKKGGGKLWKIILASVIGLAIIAGAAFLVLKLIKPSDNNGEANDPGDSKPAAEAKVSPLEDSRAFVVQSLNGTAGKLLAAPAAIVGSTSYEYGVTLTAKAPKGYISDLLNSAFGGYGIPSGMEQLLDLLSDSKVNITATTDPAAKLIGGSGYWQVAGTDIISANAVLSEDTVYFTLPQLLPKTVGIDYYSRDISSIFDTLMSDEVLSGISSIDSKTLDKMLAEILDAVTEELEFETDTEVTQKINGKSVEFDTITLDLDVGDIYDMLKIALDVILDNDDYIDAIADVAALGSGGDITRSDVEDGIEELKGEIKDLKSSADKVDFTITFLIDEDKLAGITAEITPENDGKADLGFAYKVGTGFDAWLNFDDGDDYNRGFDVRLFGDANIKGTALAGTLNIDYSSEEGELIKGKLLSFSGLNAKGGTVTFSFKDLESLEINALSGYEYEYSHGIAWYVDSFVNNFVDSDVYDLFRESTLVLSFESSAKSSKTSIELQLDSKASVKLEFTTGAGDGKLKVPTDYERYDDIEDFSDNLDEEQFLASIEVIMNKLSGLGYDIEDMIENGIGFSGSAAESPAFPTEYPSSTAFADYWLAYSVTFGNDWYNEYTASELEEMEAQILDSSLSLSSDGTYSFWWMGEYTYGNWEDLGQYAEIDLFDQYYYLQIIDGNLYLTLEDDDVTIIFW